MLDLYAQNSVVLCFEIKVALYVVCGLCLYHLFAMKRGADLEGQI
jgi:hypothetical protein